MTAENTAGNYGIPFARFEYLNKIANSAGLNHMALNISLLKLQYLAPFLFSHIYPQRNGQLCVTTCAPFFVNFSEMGSVIHFKQPGSPGCQS
jgi:hypothetical protein